MSRDRQRKNDHVLTTGDCKNKWNAAQDVLIPHIEPEAGKNEKGGKNISIKMCAQPKVIGNAQERHGRQNTARVFTAEWKSNRADDNQRDNQIQETRGKE